MKPCGAGPEQQPGRCQRCLRTLQHLSRICGRLNWSSRDEPPCRPRPCTRAVLAPAVFAQAAAVGAAVAQPALGPLRTIERLDVPRYMGTWYEIAKFTNPFQAQCTSDTRAEYTAQADGTVWVVNRCRTESGQTTTGSSILSATTSSLRCPSRAEHTCGSLPGRRASTRAPGRHAEAVR